MTHRRLSRERRLRKVARLVAETLLLELEDAKEQERLWDEREEELTGAIHLIKTHNELLTRRLSAACESLTEWMALAESEEERANELELEISRLKYELGLTPAPRAELSIMESLYGVPSHAGENK
jgi:hypothetical protein